MFSLASPTRGNSLPRSFHAKLLALHDAVNEVRHAVTVGLRFSEQPLDKLFI